MNSAQQFAVSAMQNILDSYTYVMVCGLSGFFNIVSDKPTAGVIQKNITFIVFWLDH